MTAVIDVDITSRTGKAERYYYEFYENGFGKRRINVNSSVEAQEYRAYCFNSFWPIAEAWKNGQLSNEQLAEKIDSEIEKEETNAETV